MMVRLKEAVRLQSSAWSKRRPLRTEDGSSTP